MSRWTMGLGAVLVLALAGCGGDGGGGGPTTAAKTTAGPDPQVARAAAADYAAQLKAFAQKLDQAGRSDTRLARAAAQPPRLKQVDSDDPAYVKAQATASAVTATARELRMVASEPRKRAGHLSSLQYAIGSDHWEDAFDRGNERYDKLAAILYADDGGFADTNHKDDLKVQAIWRRAATQEIASFRRFAQRMDRIRTRNPLERSAVDYALDEYDRAEAVLKEFRTQMQQPTDRDFIGWYTAVAANRNGYFSVAGAPVTHRDGLERGFVRTVRRLAAGRQAAAGDAYRDAILAGFFSPLDKDKQKRRPNVVEERGWMLFRIRQLEHTPGAAYEDARETLQLENIDDSRNAYTDALEVYKQHDAGATPKGKRLPAMAAYRTWAHTKLTEPFPTLLRPMVQRMDTLIGQFPDTTNWSRIVKLDDQIEQALRKGAKAADDPKQLKAALKAALEATRPGAAAPEPAASET